MKSEFKREARETVDAVLKFWEKTYFSEATTIQPPQQQPLPPIPQPENNNTNSLISGGPVWKFYTKEIFDTTQPTFTKKSNEDTEEPPIQDLKFWSVWSEPSSKKPLPTATGGVHFKFKIDKTLEYQFEHHRLIHSLKLPPINKVSLAIFESELGNQFPPPPRKCPVKGKKHRVDDHHHEIEDGTGHHDNAVDNSTDFGAGENGGGGTGGFFDQIALSKVKADSIEISTLGVPTKRVPEIIASKVRVSNLINKGLLLGEGKGVKSKLIQAIDEKYVKRFPGSVVVPVVVDFQKTIAVESQNDLATTTSGDVNGEKEEKEEEEEKEKVAVEEDKNYVELVDLDDIIPVSHLSSEELMGRQHLEKHLKFNGETPSPVEVAFINAKKGMEKLIAEFKFVLPKTRSVEEVLEDYNLIIVAAPEVVKETIIASTKNEVVSPIEEEITPPKNVKPENHHQQTITTKETPPQTPPPKLQHQPKSEETTKLQSRPTSSTTTIPNSTKKEDPLPKSLSLSMLNSRPQSSHTPLPLARASSTHLSSPSLIDLASHSVHSSRPGSVHSSRTNSVHPTCPISRSAMKGSRPSSSNDIQRSISFSDDFATEPERGGSGRPSSSLRNSVVINDGEKVEGEGGEGLIGEEMFPEGESSSGESRVVENEEVVEGEARGIGTESLVENLEIGDGQVDGLQVVDDAALEMVGDVLSRPKTAEEIDGVMKKISARPQTSEEIENQQLDSKEAGSNSRQKSSDVKNQLYSEGACSTTCLKSSDVENQLVSEEAEAAIELRPKTSNSAEADELEQIVPINVAEKSRSRVQTAKSDHLITSNNEDVKISSLPRSAKSNSRPHSTNTNEEGVVLKSPPISSKSSQSSRPLSQQVSSNEVLGNEEVFEKELQQEIQNVQNADVADEVKEELEVVVFEEN